MPFTKNQIITLEIKSISNDGNGVAHKDGQAVFVPLTAPGDIAEVRIVKPMKSYAYIGLYSELKLKEIIK